MIEFEILWYAGGPDEVSRCRTIGRETIRARDLTSACRKAARIFIKPVMSNAGDAATRARGFYVRRLEIHR